MIRLLVSNQVLCLPTHLLSSHTSPHINHPFSMPDSIYHSLARAFLFSPQPTEYFPLIPSPVVTALRWSTSPTPIASHCYYPDHLGNHIALNV